MTKTKYNNGYLKICAVAAMLAVALLLSAFAFVLCPASAYPALAAEQPDTNVFDPDYDTADGFAYGSGDGLSGETAFLVATPAHLDNVRNFLGDAAEEIQYYFKQIVDIDLTDFLNDSQYGWQPIGADNSSGEFFYGIYDGGLFKITGLWCDRPQDLYTGLFGYAESSRITKIRLFLAERGIIGGAIAGGIAGQVSESVIENCSVVGTVKAAGALWGDTEELFAGGIAGQIVYNSHIEYCYFSGTIIDSYAFTDDVAETADGISSRGLGGIAGYIALSRITGCYANFSAAKDDGHDLCRAIGGIVGVHGLESAIENCLAVITADGRVYPLTAGIMEGWLGFGALPNLKISGSYAYYTDTANAVANILDAADPRGLSKDEYSRVLSAQEINKRETFIGANGIAWDFATVWGFDRDGNILLRVFDGAYEAPAPIDLTWLWVTLTCILVAVTAALATFIIYKRKKPLIVKETIFETQTVEVPVEVIKEIPISKGIPLPMDMFTPSERRIAEQLLLGKSRREIAAALHLSENTVRNHTSNILYKAEVDSQTAFIAKYINDVSFFKN